MGYFRCWGQHMLWICNMWFGLLESYILEPPKVISGWALTSDSHRTSIQFYWDIIPLPPSLDILLILSWNHQPTGRCPFMIMPNARRRPGRVIANVTFLSAWFDSTWGSWYDLKLVSCWNFTSLQHLRSHQDGHWLVTVRTHDNFIVLPHWEIRPPAQLPNVPLSHIILTLS